MTVMKSSMTPCGEHDELLPIKYKDMKARPVRVKSRAADLDKAFEKIEYVLKFEIGALRGQSILNCIIVLGRGAS